MGKIVAIGGGELRLGETRKIDQKIVAMAGKTNPKLLFLPTASHDAAGYITLIHEYFSHLGCTVDTLCLCTESYTKAEITEKLLSADIIYVGGGDTVHMMNLWKEFGICQLLHQAYQRGTVLSGLSAGSICWFEFGHSDSDSFQSDGMWDYTRAYGLGLIPAAHCPHYNEAGRESFDKMMQGETLPGIALENRTALIMENDKYYILKEIASAKAFMLSLQDGILLKTELQAEQPFQL